MQQPRDRTARLARAWPLLLFPVALDPVPEPHILVLRSFASTCGSGRSGAFPLLRIQPRASLQGQPYLLASSRPGGPCSTIPGAFLREAQSPSSLLLLTFNSRVSNGLGQRSMLWALF